MWNTSPCGIKWKRWLTISRGLIYCCHVYVRINICKARSINHKNYMALKKTKIFHGKINVSTELLMEKRRLYKKKRMEMKRSIEKLSRWKDQTYITDADFKIQNRIFAMLIQGTANTPEQSWTGNKPGWNVWLHWTVIRKSPKTPVCCRCTKSRLWCSVSLRFDRWIIQ